MKIKELKLFKLIELDLTKYVFLTFCFGIISLFGYFMQDVNIESSSSFSNEYIVFIQSTQNLAFEVSIVVTLSLFAYTIILGMLEFKEKLTSNKCCRLQ